MSDLRSLNSRPQGGTEGIGAFLNNLNSIGPDIINNLQEALNPTASRAPAQTDRSDTKRTPNQPTAEDEAVTPPIMTPQSSSPDINEKGKEKSGDDRRSAKETEAGPSNTQQHHEGHEGHYRHHPFSSGHRGHCGRGQGPRGGWHGYRGGGCRSGGRGGFGNYGPWGGFPCNENAPPQFDLNRLSQFIQQFIPGSERFGADEANYGQDNRNEQSGDTDFVPAADIFDTQDAFVVHVSLPGAKKEDIGVHWNADSSELLVGGVVYRPGDEGFLNTLAVDERRKHVGVFKRTVVLGTRAKPALVDADAITAKMENGILVVVIPKAEYDLVEVKKVDIE